METIYKNPFSLPEQWGKNQLGDPYMMRFDGYTYLYCSSHRVGIKCWRSENMTDWTYVGSVCDLPETDGAYAPEVSYYDGRFYMVTSPKGSGHYLLSSDSPEGPFALVSENFGLLIDGSIFTDDDGEEYLLRAGHNGIIIHDMPEPNLPRLEGRTIPQAYLGHWTEGPMIIKRYNHYFLTYTGNHLLSRGYRIDYSVSEESPRDGYVNLHDNTLLLEVGDEFHALGHSSTVLAPDMDSYYIAYHSFDFRAEKPFRSLNIDRLFFNGARMYTNATWWEQRSPNLPFFISRNGEGLIRAEHDGLDFWQTTHVDGIFTAEACLYPKEQNVYIRLGADHMLTVLPTHHFSLSGPGNAYSGSIPDAVCMSAHLTVRVSYAADGFLSLWFNGLWAGHFKAGISGGSIGVCSAVGADNVPSYIAVSDAAYGSYDSYAQKSVPGRFDAVHHNSGVNSEATAFYEQGMCIYSVGCQKNTRLTFSVNVKEDGEYGVFARIKGEEQSVRFCVNGVQCEAEWDGVTDSEGFVIVGCGAIPLSKGAGELVFSDFSCEVQLDYIELAAHHKPDSYTVIKNGDKVYDGLQILGHKRDRSMIHKYYGFTCAENHGMAFFGETGWTDYSLSLRAHITPRVSGSLSVFLRATKESWYPAQVASSLWGYRVRLDTDGISLCRCRYGEKTVAFAAMDWHNSPSHTVDIKISVCGAVFTVYCNEQAVIQYTDPRQFAHGKVGIEARGEGYGFESLCCFEF